MRVSLGTFLVSLLALVGAAWFAGIYGVALVAIFGLVLVSFA